MARTKFEITVKVEVEDVHEHSGGVRQENSDNFANTITTALEGLQLPIINVTEIHVSRTGRAGLTTKIIHKD